MGDGTADGTGKGESGVESETGRGGLLGGCCSHLEELDDLKMKNTRKRQLG